METIDRGGGAWDVAVVIDGTYHGEAVVTKAEAVAYATRWLAAVIANDGVEGDR